PTHWDFSIDLPSSKSISNRALLLCALSGAGSSVEHLAVCDDTRVMWDALRNRPETIDIGAAGTAMRFLTAYFAVCQGEVHTLTGTSRMRNRPIGVLVDALRQLGAKISYTEREGFPPLHVEGQSLSGGTLTLPGNVSSQYISALLMIAPTMQEGLRLELEGEVLSRPYIDMTLAMLRTFGIATEWAGEQALVVQPGRFHDELSYLVESDWSAASYWYEALALSADTTGRITLPGLFKESLQGDSRIRELFRSLGVETTFDEELQQVTLTKVAAEDHYTARQPWVCYLGDTPDLTQTLVVTCAMLRRPFRFTGVRSLRIKETDRIAALQNELRKYGLELQAEGDDVLTLMDYPAGTPHYDGTPIHTYADHRMAMAFAPTAIVCEGVEIADAEVVTKSYPTFWQTLEQLSAHPAAH
ncbi:MAG: 3-phosphoshikimate 1-carboxyvinyltransferase, partial [Rothia sp. (in: high G+C Gram-positive bacteria)]|uniref:3-phosphoshikimate 1-carboxyvinyltransferase n=1 Tax=Rothia sp. (in: high G+C Gram-positive bacteria) TaxID=1885016 RepID=UPI0026E04C5F